MKKRRFFAIGMPMIVALGMGSNAYSQDQIDPPCSLGGSSVSGIVVHIDPRTGQPTSHPLPEQSAALEKLETARANRSTVGLVEEKGPTGGVMVNLRNRFQSPVVAVKQQDGSIHVDHVTCQSEGDQP
ncbi:MAG: post-PEP-CTERM-1 domain-containing protein [Gammaproteobacteria bacterium]